MRITQRCATPALLVAAGLCAQNPPGPAAIDNRFETPQVRVFVATLLPHAPVPSRNGHATNRVLIYLDNGVMTRQDGEDKVQTIEFHRGDVRWRPSSGAYVAENISDHPIRILEIDLTGKPAGPAPVSKLDRRWWMRNTTKSNSKTTRCASSASTTIHMTAASCTNTF